MDPHQVELIDLLQPSIFTFNRTDDRSDDRSDAYTSESIRY
jgi:hypothetical protein